MSNGPNDFLTKAPELPLVQKTVEAIGQGLDWLINEKLIGGLGKCLDACSAEIRGMGKSSNPFGGSLAGGLNSAPPLASGPNVSPSPSSGPSQSLEASRVPELVKEKVHAMPSSQSRGFEVAQVSNHDIGNFSPTAVGGIQQTQGQGYAMG